MKALRLAGFGDVAIDVSHEVRLEGVTGRIASASIRARKPASVVVTCS